MSGIYSVPATRRGAGSKPVAGTPAAQAVRSAGAPRKSVRMFAMAQGGRLTGDWLSSDENINAMLFGSIRVMRNRARQLARDNDLVVGFRRKMRAKIIGGDGMIYQNGSQDIIGGKVTPDKAARRIIEDAVREFSRPGNFTVCGELSRVMAEGNTLDRLITDGEAIWRIVRGFGGNRFGFALQYMDPDLLDEQYNVPASEGQNVIKMGKELDAYGRPVRYWFRRASPALYATTTQGERYSVPASEIIHVFVPELPGQVRGITWLCSSGLRLKLLQGYEEAVVVGARVAAAKMGFFKGEYEGDGVDADGRTIMTAEPGEFERLPSGVDEVIPWDPDFPSAGFAELERTIQQSLASGMAMSYPNFSGDLNGVSFSSIRQGEINDRDIYRYFHMLLRDLFAVRWHDAFLETCTLSGVIQLPAAKVEKFKRAAWPGRVWEWVNPAQQMDAYRMQAALGRPWSDIYADAGFGDFEEAVAKRESEPNVFRPELLGGAPWSTMPEDDAPAAPV
jgi:lambda family phage portal protein